MYKCLECRAIFDKPATKEGGVSYFPRPFGIGEERVHEPDMDCCPECDSLDFVELEWNGENCPFCNAIIDTSEFKDLDNLVLTCPQCKQEIAVVNGEIR